VAYSHDCLIERLKVEEFMAFMERYACMIGDGGKQIYQTCTRELVTFGLSNVKSIMPFTFHVIFESCRSLPKECLW
jgi:hypothetical protein